MMNLMMMNDEALKKHGFRAFAGEDAKWQPPDLAEVFMHETVAAWVNAYFRKFPAKKTGKLEQNRRSTLDGLKKCERYINKHFNVSQLCRDMPKRVDMVVRAGGDRIHA